MRGQVALVTGASTGMGYETIRLLASSGYLVYALSRDPEGFERSLEEWETIRCVGVDLGRRSSVREAVERIFSESGRVDLLVNNAG